MSVKESESPPEDETGPKDLSDEECDEMIFNAYLEVNRQNGAPDGTKTIQ